MKSAYELAMERLSKAAPSKPLTPKQKDELSEVESVFKARLAEKELAFQERLNLALAAGDQEKADQLRAELAQDRRRLEEDRDAKKARIRGE